ERFLRIMFRGSTPRKKYCDPAPPIGSNDSAKDDFGDGKAPVSTNASFGVWFEERAAARPAIVVRTSKIEDEPISLRSRDAQAHLGIRGLFGLREECVAMVDNAFDDARDASSA